MISQESEKMWQENVRELWDALELIYEHVSEMKVGMLPHSQFINPEPKTWAEAIISALNDEPFNGQRRYETIICKCKNIRLFRYDLDTNQMLLIMENDKEYEYSNIPISVWNELKAAEKKNIFWAVNIRGYYRYCCLNE